MLTQYYIMLKSTEIINCSGFAWLKAELCEIRYDDIDHIFKHISKYNAVKLPLERFKKYTKKD